MNPPHIMTRTDLISIDNRPERFRSIGDQRQVVILCKWIHRQVEMVVERGKPGSQEFLNPGKTGVEDPEWFSPPDGCGSEASRRLVTHTRSGLGGKGPSRCPF
jgi:hypothetical protein